jgi:hypothetical protein
VETVVIVFLIFITLHVSFSFDHHQVRMTKIDKYAMLITFTTLDIIH